MRLLDLGAFNGDSALHFIAFPAVTEIDAYEPNGDFKALWAGISEFYPAIRFHQLAVSDHNGVAKYTKRPPELPLGSTINPDKRAYGEGEVYPVQCVDIADLITEDCWLKLDVEGEEYKILERLIDTGKIDLVQRLYVEWHTRKMSGDYEKRERAILEKLTNTEVMEWTC